LNNESDKSKNISNNFIIKNLQNLEGEIKNGKNNKI
jgi:hypothetical protein